MRSWLVDLRRLSRAIHRAPLAGFLIGVCAAGGVDAHARSAAFDTWVDAFAAEWMRHQPQFATSLGYFEGDEQDALDRELDDIGEEARAAKYARALRGIEELGKIDGREFSEDQRVSAAMLAWQLDDIVRGERFEDQRFVFHQFRGLHVSLVNFLTQRHPIRNRRDIENYLVRLGMVADRIDEGIAQARGRAGRGFLPPKFILAAMQGQLDRFVSGGADENVFVTTLSERAEAVDGLDPAERDALLAQARLIVADAILPAYARLRGMIDGQVAVATDDAGLWRLPDGEAAYVHALRSYTSTDLTPDQIHEMGLREVARLEAEMDGMLAGLGYVDGPVSARIARLNQDRQPAADDPREALLAEYTRIMRDAEERAALLFDLRPRAAVEVRREPAFTEKTAAAHYTVPSSDGSRPGVFWVPLPGPPYRIVDMRTLVYHEAVPGHHFQLALQQEQEELPRFRQARVFGGVAAFSEGWALYAEYLAAESDWYNGDPAGRLGQLDKELFRARRLVVDTGIHARKWTRQQAIDYGIPAHEVDRYVVIPGQACAYKIGMMRILELRERMRSAQGGEFSIKAFHNLLLRTGTVPLDVLEQVVDEAINEGARS